MSNFINSRLPKLRIKFYSLITLFILIILNGQKCLANENINFSFENKRIGGQSKFQRIGIIEDYLSKLNDKIIKSNTQLSDKSSKEIAKAKNELIAMIEQIKSEFENYKKDHEKLSKRLELLEKKMKENENN